MKPKHLKNLLLSEINSVSKRADVFSFDSGKFFTRKRKLPFETVVKTIIGMESKSLTNEIIDAFEAEPGMPTASAFVQQRCKIKPEAFKTIFDGFTSLYAPSMSRFVLNPRPCEFPLGILITHKKISKSYKRKSIFQLLPVS